MGIPKFLPSSQSSENPIKSIRLDKQSPWRQNILVAVYLLLLSTAVRLPFFFPAVIDWDESTFILMGQSVLDGHLPYTDLWDLKPPLAFLFYAFFIALLGKSIVSVRIAGALCVTLIALFTYLIGKTLWNHRIGILGATLFVVVCSLLSGGQATMTEHVALVPLVGALSLLVAQKPTPRILFFAGILMAIASLIRLNLAYVTVIVGFFALFVKPLRSGSYILKRGLAYASGSCLVIALTYLPYAIADRQQTWWSSVILAPLSYANSHSSGEMSERIWIGVLASLAILAFIVAQWKNVSRGKRYGAILLFLFIVGTEISIVRSGATHEHYLIQLIPFLALIVAALLNALFSSKIRWLTIGVVVLALAILTKPIIAEYNTMLSHALAHKKLSYGPAYEIAAYLDREETLNEPIYMMTDHIAYWLIDKKPLSKSTTHPSNIAKEYLLQVIIGPDASTEKEMARILAQKPKFIVTEKDIWYLNDKIAAKLLLEKTLSTQYELVKQIPASTEIYRRI